MYQILIINKYYRKKGATFLSHSCSEKANVLYALQEVNKQINQKFEHCTGVSQSRLDILHQLYETGEMSQKALQQQVNIDNAAITRHLKQLEERDVVSRRKNPDDNRVTFVKLTKSGHEKIGAFRNEKARFIDEAFKDFSEEEQLLLSKMLERLKVNISAIERS